MKGKKRWAAELGFFALVVAATAYGLFHGSDLDELLRLVGTAVGAGGCWAWGWWYCLSAGSL